MSLLKVKDYFKQHNIEDRIIEFSTSSATVSLAAQALGCDEDKIAKTLSFDVSNKPILIVISGLTRIDNKKYKETFNTKAKMLNPGDVEKLIGHQIGGVCPFAINSGVDVYLDISLKKHESVYPACGSSNSAIKLSLPELEKYSNYIKWVDVGKQKDL